MLFIVLLYALVSSGLVAASVQTPTLTSCSSVQDVKVSGVSVTDAQIGKKMTLKFTLAISKPLGSDPMLKLTMKRKSGSTIPCISNVGSCTYKMCGGMTDVEERLAEAWNGQCPIQPKTVQESLNAKLDPAIEILIGTASTSINIKVEIINGGSTIGCQSFNVNIAAA